MRQAIPPGNLRLCEWEWAKSNHYKQHRAARILNTFDGDSFFGRARVTCAEDGGVRTAAEPEEWTVEVEVIDRRLKFVVSSWTEAKILAERTLERLAAYPGE